MPKKIVILFISAVFLVSLQGCSGSSNPAFDIHDITINYGNVISFCNDNYVFYSVNQGGYLSNFYSGVQSTMIKQMDRDCHFMRDIAEGMILGVTSKYVYYQSSHSSSNSIWRCECREDAKPEEILYIDYDFEQINVYAPYIMMTNQLQLDRLCIIDMRTGERLANEFSGEVSQCMMLGDHVYISSVNGGLYREKINSDQKEVVCPNTTTIRAMLQYGDKIYLLKKDNITKNHEICSIDKNGVLYVILNSETIENVKKGKRVKEVDEDYFYISNNKIFFSTFTVKEKEQYKDIFLSIDLDGGTGISYEEKVTDFINDMYMKRDYGLLTIISDKVIFCDDFRELYEHKNGDIAGPDLHLYDIQKDTTSEIKLKSYSGEYLSEYYYAKMCLDRNISY